MVSRVGGFICAQLSTTNIHEDLLMVILCLIIAGAYKKFVYLSVINKYKYVTVGSLLHHGI